LNGEHHYSQAADLCRTFFVLQSPDRSSLAQNIYGGQDSNTWSDTERQCAQSFVESKQPWMDQQWIDFGEEVKQFVKTDSSDKAENRATNSLQDSPDTKREDLSLKSKTDAPVATHAKKVSR
jgi:hypothetical protein